MAITRTRKILDWLEPLHARLKDRGTYPELSISTLPRLNNKIWGIQKGKLTLIGARTSQGKSAFALQIANDLAMQGHGVLFLSLEMDAEDIVERIFCNEYGISNAYLLRGHIHRYQKEFEEFKEKIRDRKLVISDGIGWSWNEVYTFIEGLSVLPKIIIIDYVQTIRASGDKREIIDEYVRKMRELAIRKNIAVVLVSQINRISQESKDKKPQLHHLKGSGYLEEHADIILLLHWDYKYTKHVDAKHKLNISIEKNRNGICGHCFVKFIPEFYRFEEEPQHPGEEA